MRQDFPRLFGFHTFLLLPHLNQSRRDWLNRLGVHQLRLFRLRWWLLRGRGHDMHLSLLYMNRLHHHLVVEQIGSGLHLLDGHGVGAVVNLANRLGPVSAYHAILDVFYLPTPNLCICDTVVDLTSERFEV